MGDQDREATLPIDPELDSNARAAAVDGTGAPARAGAGTQAPSRDDDDALAEIEARHGKPKSTSGKKGSSSARSSAARPAATRRNLLDDNKPVVWSREDRASGNVIKKPGEPRTREKRPNARQGANGRFLPGESGAEREFNEEPEEELDELEGADADEGDDDQGEQQEHRGREGARGDRDEALARDLLVARRALRRDGWSEEDLDGTSEQTIVRVGLHRARNQQDLDRKFADRNRDRERGLFTATRKDSRAPDTRAEHTDRDNGEGGDDLQELEAVLGEAHLDEELGRKAAKAVSGYVSKLIEQRAGSESSVVLEQLMDERERSKLGERFPALMRDGRLWDDVSALAEGLYQDGVKRGHYSRGLAGIDAAFEDAARVKLGDPERAAERRNGRKAVHAARENGSPTTPRAHREQRFASVKTREELDDLWLSARERGDKEAMQEIQAMYENPRLAVFK